MSQGTTKKTRKPTNIMILITMGLLTSLGACQNSDCRWSQAAGAAASQASSDSCANAKPAQKAR